MCIHYRYTMCVLLYIPCGGSEKGAPTNRTFVEVTIKSLECDI